jgi:hypothetical protein
MARPFDFHHTSILLNPVAWTQSLHTRRGAHMRLTAKMKRQEGQFTVLGIGDISSVSIDLTFVRGEHDWNVADAPSGYLGFLAYHGEEHSDEFGHSPAFLSGGCSLLDAIYDDIWYRLKTSTDLSPSVVVDVGPTEFTGFEDITWDRQTHKFLFITDAEFVFVREERQR